MVGAGISILLTITVYHTIGFPGGFPQVRFTELFYRVKLHPDGIYVHTI